MEKIELKCQIEKGMFSDEVQATFDTGYDRVQTLVSGDLVHNGKLVLQVDQETDDDIYVFVPGEITKGNRYIKVRKKLIEV